MDGLREGEDEIRAVHDERAILLALRRAGPLTIEDLAGRLGMGRIAVLRGLRHLDRDARITRYAERHGVGRPRHLYDAAPGGRGTVPGTYLETATSLLEAAREVGGHVLLAKMFDARARTLASRYRDEIEREGLSGAPMTDRATAFAAVCDAEGYASVLIADGDVLRFCHFNCPIFELVERSLAACEAEAAMIADVLAASVTRESHIATGARSCTFRIEARAWHGSQMAAAPPSGARRSVPTTAGWSGSQMRPAPREATGAPASECAAGHGQAWTSRQMAWPRRPAPLDAGLVRPPRRVG